MHTFGDPGLMGATVLGRPDPGPGWRPRTAPTNRENSRQSGGRVGGRGRVRALCLAYPAAGARPPPARHVGPAACLQRRGGAPIEYLPFMNRRMATRQTGRERCRGVQGTGPAARPADAPCVRPSYLLLPTSGGACTAGTFFFLNLHCRYVRAGRVVHLAQCGSICSRLHSCRYAIAVEGSGLPSGNREVRGFGKVSG